MAASRPDVVVVATTADAAYACPLAVMLRSVADRLSPAHHLEAHVIDGGLGETLRARVEASLPPGRTTLCWHPADPHRLAGLPLWGRMTVTTYNKLLVPALVPARVARALWLDADVLAQADVAALWSADLGGVSVRAVRDPVVPCVGARFGVAAWRDLGLAAAAPYFNAGVLVMDLAKWRAEGVGDRALEYLRRHWRQVYFWDQEGLNAVLAGRWAPLEPAWNWSPGLGAPGVQPRLVHFAGNLKPWRYGGRSRWHDLYYAAVDRTDWRASRPAPALGGWLSSYGASPLRRGLLPLERSYMALTRWRTLHATS
jgi:lipopolysaccharide biosynthesis glycosyltransferase